MSVKLTLVAVALAALAGGFVAAVAVVLVAGDDETDSRGGLVVIDKTDRFDGVEGDPLCSYVHRFCITHTDAGEYIAVYTADTYQPARDESCHVHWDGMDRFDVSGRTVTGLFISACNGDRFDVTGHRLFGPGPRDLDRFPVTVKGDLFEVDTGKLICGATYSGERTSCPRAPVFRD